ncbi:hypothetical protein [Mycolicibacterium sp.]
MTMAWLIGTPLAIAYAVLVLKGIEAACRSWERRHRYHDGR